MKHDQGGDDPQQALHSSLFRPSSESESDSLSSPCAGPCKGLPTEPSIDVPERPELALPPQVEERGYVENDDWEVTITNISATAVQGTFSGTLTRNLGTTGPTTVNVRNGKFVAEFAPTK